MVIGLSGVQQKNITNAQREYDFFNITSMITDRIGGHQVLSYKLPFPRKKKPSYERKGKL